MLRSSLGNIKGMTEANKNAAVDWVNKMESAKSFDDSEISAALQRMAIKTGDLGKAQDLTNVAMEVARNKHVDLATAVGLVDQAYNGSARALKQFGIEAGPDGKAQTGMAAIHALQEKVKGSGDAWSKTLEGQREQFKTTFGNFQESVGGFLMPLATKFMEVIQPFLQKAISWITDHRPGIQAVVDTVIKGISWVVETAGKMYDAIKPFIVSITETMGPYVKSLFTWLGEHGASLQDVLVGVATVIGKAFTLVAAVIKGIVDSIKWIIDHAKQAVDWVQGIAGNKGVNQGGVYASVGNVGAHASGGWVGLNGPELAIVGEKGPEYITPAGQTGANDGLLRQILAELRTLNQSVPASSRATVLAITGAAR